MILKERKKAEPNENIILDYNRKINRRNAAIRANNKEKNLCIENINQIQKEKNRLYTEKEKRMVAVRNEAAKEQQKLIAEKTKRENDAETNLEEGQNLYRNNGEYL